MRFFTAGVNRAPAGLWLWRSKTRASDTGGPEDGADVSWRCLWHEATTGHSALTTQEARRTGHRATGGLFYDRGGNAVPRIQDDTRGPTDGGRGVSDTTDTNEDGGRRGVLPVERPSAVAERQCTPR